MTAALRQKIAESGLAFIELERLTDGAVKRQTFAWFVREEQESLRLDKADLLVKLFGLRVVEGPPPRRKKRTTRHR